MQHLATNLMAELSTAANAFLVVRLFGHTFRRNCVSKNAIGRSSQWSTIPPLENWDKAKVTKSEWHTVLQST